MLKQITEQSLYAELNEFLTESVLLNESTLTLENEDNSDAEMFIQEIKFACGFHIDR
jgi:hypothetical protein